VIQANLESSACGGEVGVEAGSSLADGAAGFTQRAAACADYASPPPPPAQPPGLPVEFVEEKKDSQTVEGTTLVLAVVLPLLAVCLVLLLIVYCRRKNKPSWHEKMATQIQHRKASLLAIMPGWDRFSTAHPSERKPSEKKGTAFVEVTTEKV